MPHWIFCILVGLFNAIISYMNYRVAEKHYNICQYEASQIDTMCCITWGLTALYWLWNGLSTAG